MPQQRLGGSFAPPLSDDLLAQYKTRIDGLPPSALKDALGVLHNCAAQWWNQPESANSAGAPHPTGAPIAIVPLDDAIAKALWDHIPWTEELAAIQALCDAIPAEQKALRDCAFHLLWHAKELDLDREPLTCDKLSTP